VHDFSLTVYLRAGRNSRVSAPARLTSKAERTRTAILEAAEAVFAARGFEAARLEDVAERVGIRRASIVYYFRDKRELYEAVLRDLFGGLLEGVRGALEGRGSLAARIEAAVSTWVDYVARRPALPRLLLREVLDAGGQPPALRGELEPFFVLVRGVVARSGADPLLRDPRLDPAHVASAIAGTSVLYLTALPVLVPGFGDPLAPERLRLHREQLARVTRRLISTSRRADKTP
jgi:TetR/AcrR family transcriptional regulator